MFFRSFRNSMKTSVRRFSVSCPRSNQKENLAAVLHGIDDLRVEQRPISKPNDYQVLLQMESIGICGSDVHFLVDGKLGPFVLKEPMVIGHESSGTVLETGKCVKHLKSGDRVAIEPQVTCRRCNFCKDGRYHLCPDVAFCAAPPVDGTLARYYVHDADFCFKIAEHMSFDEGALVEPLAVAVHSCKKANLSVGDVVLVTGAGPIGLSAMLAAKAMGASAVVMTALEMGADCVCKLTDNIPDEEIITEIRGALGEDPNVTIECSGAEQCTRIGLKITRTGGVVVLTGMGQLEMNLPLTSAIFREVDIRGVFRYNNDYPTAIEIVKSGKANVKPLITHHFKIEDSVKAFETAKTREGNPLKIMIHANKDWSKS